MSGYPDDLDKPMQLSSTETNSAIYRTELLMF